MNQNKKNTDHVWSFSKIGGNERVRIESGNDIINLEQLDQKLWTALSCPIEGLDFDQKTLELIDSDFDGKIRAPEIIKTVNWITSVLKDPNDLVKSQNELQLSAIDDSNPEGLLLLNTAKQILVNIGKPNSNSISVEDTSDTIKIFANTKFNGDGIITEESTDDADLKKEIGIIIDCIGTVQDRSGKPGINQEFVEQFYQLCSDYSNWQAKAEADSAKIMPFGDNTQNALDSLNVVKSKINDYFIRCRFVEFDPRSVEVLNLQINSYENIAQKNLSLSFEEISAFPISQVNSQNKLYLEKGINPSWNLALQNFKQLVINPVLGNKEYILESEWQLLCNKFDGYTEWQSQKNGEQVEKAGLEEIRKFLRNKNKDALISLISQDLEQSDEADAIVLVDKMLRFHRHLYTLLHNFVTFTDFYNPQKNAIFQIGKLYIDQRSSDFCIKVNDAAKHGIMAHLSGVYLIYCDCKSKSKNEKMTIVAGITNGDTDNLMVGRNALFYDRNGQDWDATIVKIIENPISIRQAFWSPYKKFIRLIENQVQKFAENREKSVEQSAASNIEQSATKVTTAVPKEDSTGKKATPTAFDIGKFVGIFAAIGLAIGAIGTVLASIVAGFMSLTWWKMPLAVAGIFLLISGSSMILAWLKLRKRNLAPILDANGWTINARSLVNIPFGNTLTSIARLPHNSKRTLKDPYSNKKIPFWIYILILAAISGVFYFLWFYGYFLKIGIKL